MIALGCFKAMGAAPVCSSFCVAVTPPVRSSKYPRGLPDLRRSMQQKVRDGNSHSDLMRSTTLSTSSRTPTLHGGGGNESGSDGGQVALMLALDAAFAGLARYGAKPLASPRTLVWLAVDTQPNEFPGRWCPRGLCRLLAIALCQSAGWCRL